MGTTAHIYDLYGYKPGLYTMMMTDGGLYISVDDVVEVRPAMVLCIAALRGVGCSGNWSDGEMLLSLTPHHTFIQSRGPVVYCSFIERQYMLPGTQYDGGQVW